MRNEVINFDGSSTSSIPNFFGLREIFVQSIHFRVAFDLTSQILRRFLFKSCVSVYYHVRPSVLVFVVVPRHWLPTKDLRVLIPTPVLSYGTW
jgi:hypothetical protein